MQQTKDYTRVVIKVGTRVLTTDDGLLDIDIVSQLVDALVILRTQRMQVILVSSGAMGAGRSVVTLRGNESEVVHKQILAAVGQVKLMSTYSRLFEAHGYHCAQVLVTKEDFRDEVHYINMKNCFEGLLLDNVIPVVNENDVVATTELMFTDNDELAGLVTEQLQADALVLLTNSDGILDADGNTIRIVDKETATEVAQYVRPEISNGGRGGMRSKFTTACALAEKGIAVYIANGKDEQTLKRFANGESVGTHFCA